MISDRSIRVLIIDDSALVRKVLTEALSRFPGIEVVGTASDPYIARDRIRELNPDVLTLDMEMPRMDGLTFLRLLMRHRPIPVVVLSSLTADGSDVALEALQAGAVDVMAKPGGSYSADADGTKLAEKIRAAASARMPRPTPTLTTVPGATPERGSGGRPAVVGTGRTYPPRPLVLLGASTGGTEALRTVLTSLRPDLPGICVVQHIPERFSLAFANRLNDLCELDVREARNGDRVEPGLALVAPGGFHMLVRWHATHYTVELTQGPAVHHQRPAVDVLFDSAVKAGAAPHAIAALLTGMGADGAAGLLRLKEAGATTIAQNEETCVVFGMPREAIKLGAAQKILPLDQIAMHVESFGRRVAQ